jgi:anti-sigma28 factor (negative regulator of flagellin synthesis)
MSVTGRLSPKKSFPSKRDDFLASQSGPQIARQARLAELRRLVAAGQYRVDGERLAEKILTRALRYK